MLNVIFLSVFILKIFAVDFSKGKSCVTPSGEDATCVPLGKCEVILSALLTKGDLGQSFFKDSLCGCDMGMVCCGGCNNKSYTPLLDCALPPPPERMFLSDVSDESICGLDSSTDRIKGGGPVKYEEHPWIAAFEYQSRVTNENAGFRCGGSVVNKRYILTAAHCIVDVEFMIVKVWLGVTNTSSEEYCQNINGETQCINTVQKLDVRDIIPHEFYNSFDKFNDVGLLLLEKDIQFSKYVRPICLPSSDSDLPKIGTFLTVAGWGTTGDGQSSEIKLKVEVPIKPNNVCNEYLKKIGEEITSQQLCVGGERGKDSCEGDSGGPLMYAFAGVNHDVQWYQQGIVSFGSGCGIQGRPGVYIKVSSYASWISSKINGFNYGLENDESCSTLNSTIGTCVPITKCEEVAKALATKNNGGFDFGFKIYCSFDNLDVPLVCCENPGTIIVPNWNSTALPDKATCGILKNKPRIDGTEITDLAEFPWVAGIESIALDVNTTGIRCIGTVINSRYVLTSADCILRKDLVQLNVWLGHWNTSAYNDCKDVNNIGNCTNPVQKVKIKTTVVHPFRYARYTAYNIALIFLETEIKFSDYIKPICLPLPNVPKVELGESMTVLIGTEEFTTEFITTSDLMLKEEISLVINDKCNRNSVARNRGALTSLQMCVRAESKHNYCNRLPGAPLMRSYEDKPSRRRQWYFEGLVDSKPNDCTSNVSEEYLRDYPRVASHLYWILNIISED